MSHDYDPAWDYAIVDLDDVEEFTASKKREIDNIIQRIRTDLAPAMTAHIAEESRTDFLGFEVFFVEAGAFDDCVAKYVDGTSSRPMIGLDLFALHSAAEQGECDFLIEVELSIAHELAHAYQQCCGLEELNEDDAETFARNWVDDKEVNLWLLDPLQPRADYDPNWEYPVIEISELEEITEDEKLEIEKVIRDVRENLAPALGAWMAAKRGQNEIVDSFCDFEVFFVEGYGLGGGGVAVYARGTHLKPIIGVDLTEMKEVCEREGLGFIHQVEISIAHELAHALQEGLGLVHESDHPAGMDEDAAEVFARHWADHGDIDLWLLDQDVPRPRHDVAHP